jgi:hypothetical protein
MEGNTVKVDVKGHAVLKVQALQGVEPAAHELRVGGRGNPATVLGEEAALRSHIKPGKQRQPLVEDRTHDVTVPRTAEQMKGQEGLVLARTFKHSIILTLLLGALVLLQQYVLQWMIPK